MELDKTMKEYYSNTLDMANEELSKYTEQMEHQTSVLEHYQSLIELMGKSTDYKMIGKILAIPALLVTSLMWFVVKAMTALYGVCYGLLGIGLVQLIIGVFPNNF